MLYTHYSHKAKMDIDILEKFVQIFFDEENIKNSIIVLCQNNQNETDPISNTLITMLTTPLEIQLVVNGVRMFRGKELMFPYQYMNAKQREFLLEIINYDEKQWLYYEFCIQWKNKGKTPVFLDHLEILKSICTLVQGSKKYTDNRSKLAITNIILQRIHSNVTISKNIQQALNKFLFQTS